MGNAASGDEDQTAGQADEGLEEEKGDSNVVSETDIENYFGSDFSIVISPQVFNLRDQICQIRRYFHANPELSFEEKNTSNNISAYLKELGLRVETKIGQTGVIGVLYGKYKGPCIMLRADMDALPIQENKNELNEKFISKKANVMHACGHDAHMAILLGTARVLCKLKDYLHGTVKFVFQPAEEAGKGAKEMINDGVLDNIPIYMDDKNEQTTQTNSQTTLDEKNENKKANISNELSNNNENNDNNNINKITETKEEIIDNNLLNDHNCYVDQVYGLHVWSYIPFGQCLVKSGELMAGCNIFEIKVTGKGGHGAIPKGTNDTVLAISHLVQQLNSVISRNILPVERGVLTIGKIDTGFRSNVIAETGVISGTIRWFDNSIYDIIINRIHQICKGVEISFNVQTAFKITDGPTLPVINNDQQCVLNVKNAISQVLPDRSSLVSNPKPTMIAEDFSFFLDKRPGCFFFLGCGINTKNSLKKKNKNNNEQEEEDDEDEDEEEEDDDDDDDDDEDEDDDQENNNRNARQILAHHTPDFQIDERCLTVGTQIMCTLVLDLLLPKLDTNTIEENLASITNDSQEKKNDSKNEIVPSVASRQQ